MTERLRVARLASRIAGPFDLSAAAGECIAITGSSGSGKSLLLRMIADLDPNEGEVWLDGRPRRMFSPPEWRCRVLYSAAEPGWWTERAIDHVPARQKQAAYALADRLGVGRDRLDGLVSQLSTGERQRIALARALLAEPPVLLLDEPTGALDPAATGRVEAVLRERQAAGVTLVLVTHNAEQAARLGTQRLHMAERRLTPA